MTAIEEMRPVLWKGVVGSSAAAFGVKFEVLDWYLTLGGKALGIAVAIYTLYSIHLTVRRQRRGLFSSSASSPSTSSSSTVLLAFGLCLLCSCSLLPSERQKSEAVRSSESISNEAEKTIERTLTVTPSLALAQWGTGVVATALPSEVQEHVRIQTRSATDAGSRDSARGSLAVTIPLGVKLLLAAMGLVALVFGVQYAVKSSRGTAFGQALALGDSVISKAIERAELSIKKETDSNKLRDLNAELSALEKDRGKLKSAGL